MLVARRAYAANDDRSSDENWKLTPSKFQYHPGVRVIYKKRYKHKNWKGKQGARGGAARDGHPKEVLQSDEDLAENVTEASTSNERLDSVQIDRGVCQKSNEKVLYLWKLLTKSFGLDGNQLADEQKFKKILLLIQKNNTTPKEPSPLLIFNESNYDVITTSVKESERDIEDNSNVSSLIDKQQDLIFQFLSTDEPDKQVLRSTIHFLRQGNVELDPNLLLLLKNKLKSLQNNPYYSDIDWNNVHDSKTPSNSNEIDDEVIIKNKEKLETNSYMEYSNEPSPSNNSYDILTSPRPDKQKLKNIVEDLRKGVKLDPKLLILLKHVLENLTTDPYYSGDSDWSKIINDSKELIDFSTPESTESYNVVTTKERVTSSEVPSNDSEYGAIYSTSYNDQVNLLLQQLLNAEKPDKLRLESILELLRQGKIKVHPDVLLLLKNKLNTLRNDPSYSELKWSEIGFDWKEKPTTESSTGNDDVTHKSDSKPTTVTNNNNLQSNLSNDKQFELLLQILHAQRPDKLKLKTILEFLQQGSVKFHPNVIIQLKNKLKGLQNDPYYSNLDWNGILYDTEQPSSPNERADEVTLKNEEEHTTGTNLSIKNEIDNKEISSHSGDLTWSKVSDNTKEQIESLLPEPTNIYDVVTSRSEAVSDEESSGYNSNNYSPSDNQDALLQLLKAQKPDKEKLKSTLEFLRQGKIVAQPNLLHILENKVKTLQNDPYYSDMDLSLKKLEWKETTTTETHWGTVKKSEYGPNIHESGELLLNNKEGPYHSDDLNWSETLNDLNNLNSSPAQSTEKYDLVTLKSDKQIITDLESSPNNKQIDLLLQLLTAQRPDKEKLKGSLEFLRQGKFKLHPNLLLVLRNKLITLKNDPYYSDLEWDTKEFDWNLQSTTESSSSNYGVTPKSNNEPNIYPQDNNSQVYILSNQQIELLFQLLNTKRPDKIRLKGILDFLRQSHIKLHPSLSFQLKNKLKTLQNDPYYSDLDWNDILYTSEQPSRPNEEADEVTPKNEERSKINPNIIDSNDAFPNNKHEQYHTGADWSDTQYKTKGLIDPSTLKPPGSNDVAISKYKQQPTNYFENDAKDFSPSNEQVGLLLQILNTQRPDKPKLKSTLEFLRQGNVKLDPKTWFLLKNNLERLQNNPYYSDLDWNKIYYDLKELSNPPTLEPNENPDNLVDNPSDSSLKYKQSQLLLQILAAENPDKNKLEEFSRVLQKGNVQVEPILLNMLIHKIENLKREPKYFNDLEISNVLFNLQQLLKFQGSDNGTAPKTEVEVASETDSGESNSNDKLFELLSAEKSDKHTLESAVNLLKKGKLKLNPTQLLLLRNRLKSLNFNWNKTFNDFEEPSSKTNDDIYGEFPPNTQEQAKSYVGVDNSDGSNFSNNLNGIIHVLHTKWPVGNKHKSTNDVSRSINVKVDPILLFLLKSKLRAVQNGTYDSEVDWSNILHESNGGKEATYITDVSNDSSSKYGDLLLHLLTAKRPDKQEVKNFVAILQKNNVTLHPTLLLLLMTKLKSWQNDPYMSHDFDWNRTLYDLNQLLYASKSYDSHNVNENKLDVKNILLYVQRLNQIASTPNPDRKTIAHIVHVLQNNKVKISPVLLSKYKIGLNLQPRWRTEAPTERDLVNYPIVLEPTNRYLLSHENGAWSNSTPRNKGDVYKLYLVKV